MSDSRRSQSRASSRSSSKSSTAIAEAKAKVAEASVRAAMGERMDEARLEATRQQLEVDRLQREAESAVAQARLKAIAEAFSEEESEDGCGSELPSPTEKVNMLLSRNDPALVPFSMIDMDPEVNQLDTVTGVSPTIMGTLGLGLETVGLPDSQGLSADMYNTMPAPSSPYVLPRMSTSGTVGLPVSQGLSADMYNTMPAPSSPYVLPRMSTSGIQYTAHQPRLLATPACQGHTASFMSPPMVSSRISSKPTTSATATGSQVMYTTTPTTSHGPSLPHSAPIYSMAETPRGIHSGGNPTAPAHSTTYNLGDYLIRQELISRKIPTFDDHPEKFRIWHAAFHNMVKGVPLSSEEKLNLMAQHMANGSESKALVERISRVYIANPDIGLNQAWERLQERFGSDEAVTQALTKKVEFLSVVSSTNHKGLQKFSDTLEEIQAAKDDGSLLGLAALDTPYFIRPIVAKLPPELIDRWKSEAFKYKELHHGAFPPFSHLSSFVRRMARIRNDVSLMVPSKAEPSRPADSSARWPTKSNRPAFNTSNTVLVSKTDIATETPSENSQSRRRRARSPSGNVQCQRQLRDPTQVCPIHQTRHPLAECRAFRAKPVDIRLGLLSQWGICCRCASSTHHLTRDCRANPRCFECHSNQHCSALHYGPSDDTASDRRQRHGEEPTKVTSTCTEICGSVGTGGKSCSKICLVKVFTTDNPDNVLTTYAVLDDQSNRSLGHSKLFDHFNVHDDPVPYELRTCAGTTAVSGRRVTGLVIESFDGIVRTPLPVITECDAIPSNRSEIPTPDIANLHCHMRSIAGKIPTLHEGVDILLLIGRDAPQLLKVRESRNGPADAPWAQRMDLGWVIIGDVCLNGAHKPDEVEVYRTHILESGRPSICSPCPSRLSLRDVIIPDTCTLSGTLPEALDDIEMCGISVGRDVYARTKNDDKLGRSIDDNEFLAIMETGFFKDEKGNWVAPLPFRRNAVLPDNRPMALNRFRGLRKLLDRKPALKQKYVEFMGKLLSRDHAEPVKPGTQRSQPRWYLPHFGVFHPRKPDNIRVVFDSSATWKGTSLNKALLTGPDLINSLFGVLIRFRQEPVAIIADIEHMFYCFSVREDHRDFLRFLWFKDNDPNKEVSEYRMKVHVFGNGPSPAIAAYGLRKTAQLNESGHGKDARRFVEQNFYVDDGLTSLPTPDEAIDLLTRTRDMLSTANLRLHKIASNSVKVMSHFPQSEHTQDLRNLDLSTDPLPVQRSLGVSWDLHTDTIIFTVPDTCKTFTRRGVLSTVNSIYDPLGLAAPVVVKGKMLLRKMTLGSKEGMAPGWDEPLADDCREQWENWCTSLTDLSTISVQRAYSNFPMSASSRRELHVFSDASTEAIAVCSYLRLVDDDNNVTVRFVAGKAKLSPLPTTTIPRLELCAAVLAVELTDVIVDELDIELTSVTFYTDSRVVLGYINNESRRFYVYVTNRVQRIRRSTSPAQWNYVATDINPADIATRSVKARELMDSPWLHGPEFLQDSELITGVSSPVGDLDNDPEVRSAATFAARLGHLFGTQRFSRFSSWSDLVRAIARLIAFICAFKASKQQATRQGGTRHHGRDSADTMKQATTIIITSIQRECYSAEIDRLSDGRLVDKASPLYKLNPLLDEDGVLVVGGRLAQANLAIREKHPTILPKQHHVSTLVVQHCHKKVHHQGRNITAGALRAEGYWIVGSKRLIDAILNKCVTCRKLRGKRLQQQMADLPPERIEPSAPFTHVGLDVFGPWEVITRRTRGGSACSKRWAVLFTCMSTRAVHIEVIEEMTASSFINALRRFMALRGPVKCLYSDCGTNFIGAHNVLNAALKEMDKTLVNRYLTDNGLAWKFNVPRASHMGGVWERMIGVCRRILDAVLRETKVPLTHELLTTFLAEVCAIVNSRPLVPVSTDPEAPEILTPATILTMKTTPLYAPPGDYTQTTNTFGRQWRRVQHLAETFWSRWRREFLPTLQPRTRWHSKKRDLRVGDVVLLNIDAHRNDWPYGRVISTLPSSDGRVRKARIKTAKNGDTQIYSRPVTELILLLPAEEA